MAHLSWPDFAAASLGDTLDYPEAAGDERTWRDADACLYSRDMCLHDTGSRYVVFGA